MKIILRHKIITHASSKIIKMPTAYDFLHCRLLYISVTAMAELEITVDEDEHNKFIQQGSK